MRLKGGHTTRDPRLDRVPQWDERNRSFPIRELVGDVPLRTRSWRLLKRLDQGTEGACVGFGWSHELAALPVGVKGVADETARAVYRRAQQIDEWPGEQYSGTSVLAGAKAVQEQGHLREYRWAFSEADVLATLSHHGPVVIGVNWHTGMFDTDSEGFIHPTGQVEGGHCVVLRGVGRRSGRWFVVGRNSWGVDWGERADFRLWADDLGGLLSVGGDACVPVSR